jgi:methionine synthase II (cobalamin-independent)
MSRVTIHQSAKDVPGGILLLTTSIVDSETGEIYSSDVTARLKFAWDSLAQAALDEAVKHAESAGATEIQIDSPFYEMLEARKRLLKELTE